MKKKNRPYKYNAKSRLTPNSQSFPFKVNSFKKDVVTNLENTLTKLRIIDDTVEKKETLDDGFLRGRFNRKEEKKKKKKKDTAHAKKEKLVALLTSLRKIVLSISAIGAVIIVVMLSYRFVGEIKTHFQKSNKNKVSVGVKNSSYHMDDSFVFVGDFYTKDFPFEKYGFDYHFVNVGQKALTTDYVLQHMKEMVYDYNPSVVFVEIGIMDLDNGVSQEQFIKNYGKIIDLISTNRPNATIVVESIYPINLELSDEEFFHRVITNNEIKEFNDALQSLSNEKKVKYLDLYSQLLKSGELNSEYSDNGIDLNNKGYRVVYKEIKKIVG